MTTRVSVVANSVGLMVSGPEDGGGAPYPVHLETLLSRSGRKATVWNHSRWMGMLDGAVADWERSVLATWPDLVVLQFGLNECRSALVPRAFHVRRFQMVRSFTYRNRLWRRALDLVWVPVFAASRALETRWTPAHMSARRFGLLVEHFLTQTTRQTGAAVAVIDVHPTTRILERLSPNYALRRDRLQAILEAAVEAHPRAYRVELGPLVDKAGGDRAALPDGFHFSALMHQLVAEKIAQGYLDRFAGDAWEPA